MVALDDLDVLEPLAGSPALSLTTKRALARLNRVARTVVTQHLRGNCILVHDEDAIVANVPFVRAWLRVYPGAVLKVHGHDGEMKLGMALRAARTNGNTIFGHLPERLGGGLDFNVGPLIHSPTAAFFLAHVLAKTWARFRGMCTTAQSMTIMEGPNLGLNARSDALLVCDRALRFHNAMFRTEKRIVVDNDDKYANEQLRQRLQPWSQEAQKQFYQLYDRAVVRMARGSRGTVHLANLHLTDDAMTVIGPRVRALADHVEHIKAHNNRFGLRGATTLFAEPHQQGDAHAPRWPVLKHLDLSSIVGSDGHGLPLAPLCSAIADKHMPNLGSLDLSDIGMGDVGARLVFATLRHLPCLHTLDLSQNPISLHGLNTLMPKAAAGGLVDGTRVARIGVIAPKLLTLSMIDMCKMGKAAWMRLAHAILGGGFPEILNLRTENPGTIMNKNKTFERTRPAMLALTAFCSQRIADVDHKRALDAIKDHVARVEARSRLLTSRREKKSASAAGATSAAGAAGAANPVP